MPVDVVEAAPADLDVPASPAPGCRRAVALSGAMWVRRYDWETLGSRRLGLAASPDLYTGCTLGGGPVRFAFGVETAPLLPAASFAAKDPELRLWMIGHAGVEWQIGEHLVVSAGGVVAVGTAGGDVGVRWYPTPKIRKEGLEIRAAVFASGPSTRLSVGYTWDAGALHGRR